MQFNHQSSIPGNAFRVKVRVRPLGHWQSLFGLLAVIGRDIVR